MKWEETLADGKWHHFNDITSIYYAGLAHLDGRIERKEKKVISYTPDGTEIVKTIVMFKLPDGNKKISIDKQL